MAKNPRIFCSSKHHDQSDPPLPTASLHIRLHDFDVWSVESPISSFLNEIRPLLAQRTVVSACILSVMPPEGKEWLFFEWHGKLVISLDLVALVFHDTDTWKETQVHEGLNVAIFDPKNLQQANFETQAEQYRSLLEGNKKGEVILRREWIETRKTLESLFGRYADPGIGGAIALLSLSGAANPDLPEFTLRTPAALDLDIDTAAESLVAQPARENLTIRCIGCSQLGDFNRAAKFQTSPDKWAELHAEASKFRTASFFIALELGAAIDPTIVIPRGAVFEQQKLVGVQTLAAAIDVSTIVDVDEVKPLIIPAYCLNSELGPPSGQPIRPTPFIYRRASGTQHDVWQARGRR
jgi:hypothetical protein